VSSGSVQQDLLCDCLLDLVPKGRCDFLALLRDVLLQKLRLTIKLLRAVVADRPFALGGCAGTSLGCEVMPDGILRAATSVLHIWDLALPFHLSAIKYFKNINIQHLCAHSQGS
jgi:hypothetical protein